MKWKKHVPGAAVALAVFIGGSLLLGTVSVPEADIYHAHRDACFQVYGSNLSYPGYQVPDNRGPKHGYCVLENGTQIPVDKLINREQGRIRKQYRGGSG